MLAPVLTVDRIKLSDRAADFDAASAVEPWANRRDETGFVVAGCQGLEYREKYRRNAQACQAEETCGLQEKRDGTVTKMLSHAGLQRPLNCSAKAASSVNVADTSWAESQTPSPNSQ